MILCFIIVRLKVIRNAESGIDVFWRTNRKSRSHARIYGLPSISFLLETYLAHERQ